MSDPKPHPESGSRRGPTAVPPGGLEQPTPNVDPTNPSQPADPTRPFSGNEVRDPQIFREGRTGSED